MMKLIVALLAALLTCSCAKPVRRSLALGVDVGDSLRVQVPAVLMLCSAWKATSPVSTRQEPVPCLAAALGRVQEGARRIEVGTTVKVVRLLELGLVDSSSTQVFVSVPGHSGTYLVTEGDMRHLFPQRSRERN